jgi:NADH-quinone oxidoreductase subunit H
MNNIVDILIEAGVKILVIVNMVLLAAAALVYLERKISAFIQNRIGPNRVGPMGLLQPFADVIKLFMKEDITPTAADSKFHRIAPIITLGVAVAVYSVIPFGDFIYLNGRQIYLGLATSPNVNIGLLFVLAMTSVGVYGITLAGWSSNNKYSLMGGLRSSAQMISYEISMGLALVGVILITGSFGLTDIVRHQTGWMWNILLQPLGFIIFLTSSFAEMNRAPFDLPEAEPELVGGFNTEYTGMKFGMFFLAEYANMATSAALISLIYLGGWNLPFDPTSVLGLAQGSIELAVFQFAVLMAKIAFMVFFIIWVRWSIPRFRYDQLMSLGWKALLPLSLANIVLTAVAVYFLK